MTTATPAVESPYTPAEVAELLRVDTRTVTRWAKAGRIPSFRTVGGHRRYRAADIRALLDGVPPASVQITAAELTEVCRSLAIAARWANNLGSPGLSEIRDELARRLAHAAPGTRIEVTP